MTTFKKMKNVLIVDDNPSDIVIAKFVAEQQELNPVIVNDGFSALQALESNDFSLFIIDLQMPKMSGLELVKRLRRTAQVKKTPILIMSGRNKSADVAMAVKMGATDYIVKPVDIMIMESKVKNLTRGELESWQEYTLVDEPNDILTQLDGEIISICEVGLTMSGIYPFSLGDTFSISTQLLDKLTIGSVMVRVVESNQVNGKFVSKVMFIAMSEEQRKRLRLLCMDLWNHKVAKKAEELK